ERPGPPPQRARALNETEIRWFWKACDQLGGPYGPLFKTLLLTGARLDEVTGMNRAELTEQGTVWIIPAERAKNHRAHLVPVPPLAREILSGAPQNGELVFTIGGSKLTGFSRAKAQLDTAMRTAAYAEDRVAVLAPWRLHDLRRTLST